MRHRYASVLYLKEVKGMSKGTVRSTERSSNVSLLTCHTCVVDVDESRDFSLFSNKLSVLDPSKLFSVNHRISSS